MGALPATLGLALGALAPEAVEALPASLAPPQAARAALRVTMATPWPSTRQILSVLMSFASLSGEDP
jgi:hypothetical protein